MILKAIIIFYITKFREIRLRKLTIFKRFMAKEKFVKKSFKKVMKMIL